MKMSAHLKMLGDREATRAVAFEADYTAAREKLAHEYEKSVDQLEALVSTNNASNLCVR